MKISIWQQFSSNHSGSFEIVGRFESPEKAQEVAGIIKGHLRDIHEWRVENHEKMNSEYDRYRTGDLITKPEQKLIDTYDIEWGDYYLIDWWEPKRIDETVVVFQNCVFLLSTTSETYNTPAPFKVIMEHLGGKVFAFLDQLRVPPFSGNMISLNVIAKAPTNKIAQEIVEDIVGFVTLEKEIIEAPAPWIIFAGGQLHPQADLIRRVGKRKIERAKRLNELDGDLTLRRLEAQKNFEKNQEELKQLDELQRKNWVQMDQELPAYSMENRITYSIADEKTHLDFETFSAEVSVNEKVVTMSRLMVSYENLHTALPALVAWLEDKDCLVGYEFSQEYIDWYAKSKEWQENQNK